MRENGYAVPVGEQGILHAAATATASFPPERLTPDQTITGQLHLTSKRVDMVPSGTGVRVTVGLAELTGVEVVVPTLLWFIKRAPRLSLTTKDAVNLSVDVADPTSWAEAIRRAVASMVTEVGPSQCIDDALAAGIQERDRYADALLALSFPAGFWHVEAFEDLADVVMHTFRDLGIPLPIAFVEDLLPTLDVEDSLIGSDETAARREQVNRIARAINEALPSDEKRRLYAFVNDIPGWEDGEAVWVWLLPEQRDNLVRGGIVSPFRDAI